MIGDIYYPATCTSPAQRCQFLNRFRYVFRTIHNWFGKWYNTGLTTEEYNKLINCFAHYMAVVEDPSKTKTQHIQILDTAFPFKAQISEAEWNIFVSNQFDERMAILDGTESQYRDTLESQLEWSEPIDEPTE